MSREKRIVNGTVTITVSVDAKDKEMFESLCHVKKITMSKYLNDEVVKAINNNKDLINAYQDIYRKT